ncbi:thioredoxin domain-containing protein [Chitinophaga arvensicola]|uniref:Thioredoxin n=1 Tax=Chitinophaga arvensicola TaxID=29529 RepID=A0A1I0SBB4_9BACT|nr:thioredoxin domain-containing protein [Chitinophaga arvensicola]SEW53985.1 Thioredoxin [Chitinophaga arvensicola]
MRKKMISLMAIFSMLASLVSAQGIEFFHGTWAEAKAAAQKENKLIFVDFYTTWCGPCKFMSNEVFPLKQIGDFYNPRFISVKIDAEKGEGPELARKYGVSGYPTLIFTNPKEEVVYSVMGSTDPEVLITQGKIATTPMADFTAMTARYEKNELNKAELFQYLNLVKAKGDDKKAADVFAEYFKAIDHTITPDLFKLITSYVDNSDNAAFKYVEDNRAAFEKAVGKEKTAKYVDGTLLDEVKFARYESEGEYRSAKLLLKSKMTLDEEEELSLDANYAYNVQDEDGYMKYSKLLVDKYYWNNDFEISNVLGSVRWIKKEENLQLMKRWAERALSLKDNSLNNISLAMTYSALKDKTTALKYVAAALAASERDKDGYVKNIEMLKQMIVEGR